MKIPFDEFLRVLWYEVFRHRMLLIGAFLVINAAIVLVALNWPPTYQSSTTILVEQKNIIQPLMQGTAVATDVRDQARIAREIVFSRKVLTEALTHSGLLQDGQTDIQQEKIIEAAKGRTKIVNVGTNLIRIEYKDRNPERAYATTQKFAELFMLESLGSQAQESQAAFEFIDRQVREYHEKLTQAEEALKQFRSENLDARPGTATEVSRRIDELEAAIERTSLEIKEARIKEASIEKQLSGEAEVTVALTRESQYTARIAELRSQLEDLRLNYHDTYPDIVRLKHQIEDLREALAKSRREREEALKAAQATNRTYVDESVRVNPIYQQLKQQLFDTRTNIQTLQARLAEAKERLNVEMERAARIHSGEATLAELTRDYEVNRDIYQDLLRRRENARVSRNLDRDKQELALQVHEPAFLPLQPSGMRFLHIVIGGLVLSVVLPIGVLYGFLQLDPRVRLQSIIATRLKLPVLTVVPHYWTPSERQVMDRQLQWLAVLAVLSIVAVGVFATLRASQVV